MSSELKGAASAASQKAFSLFAEFKAFALKGNVIDLAIGVIIGAAFGKIIDSLVKDIFMPLIAALLPGDKGYLGWSLMINGSEVPYGKFIGEVINFTIIAFVLFLFMKKFLGWVMRSKQQEETVPAPLSKDQELLTEIRDLLKRQSDSNAQK